MAASTLHYEVCDIGSTVACGFTAAREGGVVQPMRRTGTHLGLGGP